MIKKRNVILMLVVLVLLVGAVLAVNFLLQEPEDPQTDTTAESIEIFKVEKDQIVQMDCTVNGEQFVFVKQEEDQWAVQGRPEVKLRNSSVDMLAMEFASISGSKKIADSADDLSIYGLEQPQGAYTIHLSDGTQKQFAVGNSDPVSGAYYFKMGDTPEIYTIYSTKATSLLKSLDDYRDTTFLTVNTESLNYVLVQTAGQTVELALETTGEGEEQTSDWVMRQPLQKPGDIQRISETIIQQVSSLSIDSFVNDGLDHGLGSPAATVTLSDADGASQTLYVGDEDADGMRYVKLDGDANVYLVDGENLEFIQADPFLFISKFLNLENIDNVASIDITTGGTTQIMTITRDGENAVYHVDGVETVEDTFKDLYQKVIGLTASGIITAQPSGDPAVTVVYHLVDGTAEVLQFYDYDDRNYAVVKDGVCEFRILKKDVDNMLSAVQTVADGTKQE